MEKPDKIDPEELEETRKLTLPVGLNPDRTEQEVAEDPGTPESGIRE